MTSKANQAINPLQCPLCGKQNQCASADSNLNSSDCWCMQTAIPKAALDKIPRHLKNKQCICAVCAAALATSATNKENTHGQ